MSKNKKEYKNCDKLQIKRTEHKINLTSKTPITNLVIMKFIFKLLSQFIQETRRKSIMSTSWSIHINVNINSKTTCSVTYFMKLYST